MFRLVVSDVGDGLCLGLKDELQQVYYLDCGSQNGVTSAFNGYVFLDRLLGCPSSFILSHFHSDHYNGLCQVLRSYLVPTKIDNVFYPKMPEFSRKQELLEAVYSMSLFFLGNETGIMEYDLLKIITHLNKGVRPHNHPLWKGKLFGSNNIYEVLWPPYSIREHEVHSDVYKALDSFNQALEQNPELQELYSRVHEEKSYRENILKEEFYYERELSKLNIKHRKKFDIPSNIDKANELLKKATNRMSLSFKSSNELLFLGDLESEELRIVIEDLLSRLERNYVYLVTAHHGTHEHEIVQYLNCRYSISSVGSRLFKHLKQIYSQISQDHRVTWINGDGIY